MEKKCDRVSVHVSVWETNVCRGHYVLYMQNVKQMIEWNVPPNKEESIGLLFRAVAKKTREVQRHKIINKVPYY